MLAVPPPHPFVLSLLLASKGEASLQTNSCLGKLRVAEIMKEFLTSYGT
jgi:hypothetical protein